MAQRLKAIYQNAHLSHNHLVTCLNSEVDLVIERPHLLPPLVTDPDERKRIMEELVQNMRDNPIPENAPYFTREELHERR